MDIKKLIGETTEYDKKQSVEIRRPKSWLKSVSAFANGDGGYLIFGIADDGTVVGLLDAEKDAEAISERIKARMDPIPEFFLSFEEEENKTLIILKISKGEETPYYYSGDGTLETFVRVGNESVKATATEQKRLVMRGKNSSYDSQVSSYVKDDFAFTKLRARYKKWTGKSFEDKDMISFGLVEASGKLTNAGALLADDSPIRWSRLFCTRWNGLNKSGGTIDAVDDAEFSGSLIYLLENGEEFIQRNCRKMWKKTPNSREEMPEYVERSYHEVLINALAHRDYLVNGSMERKGSGFGKIIDAYEFQVNYTEDKKPYFRSDRAGFVAIMPNLNYDVPQGDPQDVPQDVPQDGTIDERIIALIIKDSSISTEQMAAFIGVSAKTIKRHIKKMNNIKYVGSGYSGHWEIEE